MIVLAGIERGLSYDSLIKMTIGQVVDFCVEYNNRNAKKEKPAKRKATKADFHNFFGV